MKRFYFLFITILALSSANAQTLFSSSPNPASLDYPSSYRMQDSDWEYYGTIRGQMFYEDGTPMNCASIDFEVYYKNVGRDAILKAVYGNDIYSVRKNPYYRNRSYGAIANYAYYLSPGNYFIFFNL